MRAEHFSRFCRRTNAKDLAGDVFKINIFSSSSRAIHSEMTDVNKTIIAYLSEAPSAQQLTRLIKEKPSFTAPFSRRFPSPLIVMPSTVMQARSIL